jgi:serine/threonine protein kinase
VSEYYAHGTLFDLLVRHKQKLGTRRGIPEPLVLEFTRQILAALAYMHRNSVIHRDIKPSNVLVSDDETTLALTDFGLSKEINAGEYVKTRIGTYHYMAPEQMTGSKYNSKADVWAAGCLIYAMCTAKISTRDAVVMFTVRKSPDFDSRIRAELRNMYSEELIAFMLRTLIEKPSDRPGSEEALGELEALMAKRNPSMASSSHSPRDE